MAKYVPITDYDSANFVVQQGRHAVLACCQSEGKWYSSSRETDYYDHPDKPGVTVE